jgi:glycine dehydrogenase subunit 1
MALASAVYMSALGKNGIKKVAELCYQKAHYAARRISEIPGYNLCFDTPYFHEFAVCCDRPIQEINLHLLDHGILGGYDLGNDFPSLQNHMLIAVTEMNSKEEIDALCDILEEIAHE